MRVRQAAVKERIDDGYFNVVYVPTAQMTADVMTKPLQGKLYYALCGAVSNTVHPLFSHGGALSKTT